MCVCGWFKKNFGIKNKSKFKEEREQKKLAWDVFFSTFRFRIIFFFFFFAFLNVFFFFQIVNLLSNLFLSLLFFIVFFKFSFIRKISFFPSTPASTSTPTSSTSWDCILSNSAFFSIEIICNNGGM